jgi:beta-N-acetylhexosaminidase
MAKNLVQFIILISFLVSFTSFVAKENRLVVGETYLPVKQKNPAFISSNSQWADSVLSLLSLDEKIAQFIMVAAYSSQDESHVQNILQLIEKHGIGGIAFFQGGPVRQLHMTQRFQNKSKVPLLIAIDGEWGLGMRLDSTMSFPRQMTLGAIQDDEMIYQMGYHIGYHLKRMGIHVNFAPVADVNNNPENPVINFRSFGENRMNVARKSLSYAQGLEDAGIIATLKHFPGHGDTNTDSHHTLPVIYHNRERLDSIEMFPFNYCISNGVPAVMTAHLNIPALDSTVNLASSLSYPIVNDILKDSLGFKGLIFTDALNMKGASDYFKPGELEARAFIAGNDILLMPSDVEKSIQAIKREIKRGNITEEEIDRRCRKVLLAKAWAGLDKAFSIKTDSIFEDLNSPYVTAFKNELIRQSLTLVKNENSSVPFLNLEKRNFASIAIGTGKSDVFSESLKLYTDVNTLYIPKSAAYDSMMSIANSIVGYNTLIISIQETNTRPSENFGVTKQTINFLKDFKFQGDVIVCIFGNPYLLSSFDGLNNIHSILLAYENTNDFKHLSAQGLFGAFELKGLLPVTASTNFTSGKSINIPAAQRLSYGIPEEVLIDSRKLYRIDSLVQSAISQKAMPGCQILIARYGKVIYNKPFGFHSYNGKKKVSSEDLYDIASITKIVGTLPLLMQLFDEGKIDINDHLGKHLPSLDTSNKAGLVISDILAHQAGLQAWLPFYYSLITPIDTSQILFNNKISAEYPLKLANNLFLNRNVRLNEDMVSDQFSPEFSLQVADRIFLNNSIRDSIYQKILASPLGKKQYLYSDLGLFLLHQLIEEVTDSAMNKLLNSSFYNPMGTSTLGYHPLNRFPKNRIVPTENDLIFRNQLLQGYVHDPGAAMLGGIAGHAGLFANANDLAKMMQMYLNGGMYGGRKYLNDSTINKFTACTYCNNGNRRGLGFDKPEPDPKKINPCSKYASPSSFGHSGFTGTLVWSDPQYGLIYVFLSNRIHPDQFNTKLTEMNLRTNIQDVIYQALLDLKL